MKRDNEALEVLIAVHRGNILMAEACLAALEAAGLVVVPASTIQHAVRELEELDEMTAQAQAESLRAMLEARPK